MLKYRKGEQVFCEKLKNMVREEVKFAKNKYFVLDQRNQLEF